MKIRSFLYQKIFSGNRIWFFISAVVIAHVFIMIAYTQYAKITAREYLRDEAVEQMIYVINLLKNTEPQQHPQELQKLSFPNLTYSITATPLWPLHIEKDQFWLLENIVRDSKTEKNIFSVSYHLDNKKWLNLYVKVQPKDLGIQLFVIILEIVVAAALLFSAWSVERFTKPLKSFQRAAFRLGVDVHTESVPIYGPTIVRETALAMNQMQKRIQELLSNRTKMLAAISHDLRTPITRLKLRAQFITDKEQYQKTIKDLDEMEVMIEQILSFAKAEFSDEPKIKLDLQSMLASICDDLQDLGHPIQYIGTHSRVPFKGRSLALKRAFSNVIHNALKYSTQVTVDCRSSSDGIQIKIQDNGPGIPDSAFELVFEPFYRLDKARSSDTGGIGLGLAVTRDIVRAHQGKIQLKNLTEGGLVFMIQFPKENK